MMARALLISSRANFSATKRCPLCLLLRCGNLSRAGEAVHGQPAMLPLVNDRRQWCSLQFSGMAMKTIVWALIVDAKGADDRVNEFFSRLAALGHHPTSALGMSSSLACRSGTRPVSVDGLMS